MAHNLFHFYSNIYPYYSWMTGSGIGWSGYTVPSTGLATATGRYNFITGSGIGWTGRYSEYYLPPSRPFATLFSGDYFTMPILLGNFIFHLLPILDDEDYNQFYSLGHVSLMRGKFYGDLTDGHNERTAMSCSYSSGSLFPVVKDTGNFLSLNMSGGILSGQFDKASISGIFSGKVSTGDYDKTSITGRISGRILADDIDKTYYNLTVSGSLVSGEFSLSTITSNFYGKLMRATKDNQYLDIAVNQIYYTSGRVINNIAEEIEDATLNFTLSSITYQ